MKIFAVRRSIFMYLMVRGKGEKDSKRYLLPVYEFHLSFSKDISIDFKFLVKAKIIIIIIFSNFFC